MLFLSTYPNPLRNHSSSVKKHHSFLKCNETYFVLSELLLVKLTLHMFAMHSHMIRSVKDKKVLLRTPNNPLQTNFWRPSVREGSKAPQPPPHIYRHLYVKNEDLQIQNYTVYERDYRVTDLTMLARLTGCNWAVPSCM